MTPQSLELNVSDIRAADLYRSRLHVIQSRNKSRHRALAGAVLSDDGDLLARGDSKRRNAKHILLSFIPKLHLRKFQSPMLGWELREYWRIGYAWWQTS